MIYPCFYEFLKITNLIGKISGNVFEILKGGTSNSHDDEKVQTSMKQQIGTFFTHVCR